VIELALAGRSAAEIERMARRGDPPVIGTIRDGRFRLDPRTLADDEVRMVADSLARALG
jgi:L-seryl-tRNA(Ser) seleniumtransferase